MYLYNLCMHSVVLCCLTWEYIMNKSEQREFKNVCLYMAAGMHDTAARALSALIRAARTNKSRQELLARAQALQLVHLPEFII